MSFQQNKYQVIKNAISYELANFCFNYFLLKRDAVNYMYNTNMIAENGMYTGLGPISKYQGFILFMQITLWKHY
jgi:hypothetical protein